MPDFYNRHSVSDSIFYPIHTHFKEKDFPQYCELHARCSLGGDQKTRAQGGPVGCLGDLSHETLRQSVERGRRFNALIYKGEDKALPHFYLKDGDWLGCIRFKKTAFFPPPSIHQLLEDQQKGYSLAWDRALALGFPPLFKEACRLSQDAQNAPVALLEFVCVLPDLRGFALVQQLLASTQAQLKGEGIQYLVVYGRIPHFWRHTLDHMPKMALLKSLFSPKAKQEMIQKALPGYIQLKRPDGFHPDWGIRFHQQAGGKLICPIQDYANDPESAHQGALILYDLDQGESDTL